MEGLKPMRTLEELQELASSIATLPDERPEWLKVLQPDTVNLYHRFIFEVARRSLPRTSWEIGSCEGAGAGHLGEGNPRGLVITVDISPEAKSRVDALFIPNVVTLLSDSLEVLDRIKWKPEIDLLFIDGEHSRRQVEAEYRAYRPLVRPGGFILFDDIALSQEMAEAWAAITDPKVDLNHLHFSGFGAVQKQSARAR
jgi:predicted O-methyltransferase YrrM